ncbi:MAG TPA: hypothetical protein VHC39_01430 [Rhizomicrobium sp.]|nr:hypothetical protein [Rhizomicrobium sp.]
MSRFKRAAVSAAGFAAVSAVALPLLARAVLAADLPPSLQSFGAAKALSAYELSAPGLTDGGLQNSFAGAFTGNGLALSTGNPTFAASTLLASNLALDSGSGLDVASRFLAYNGEVQPFLAPVAAPYLSLANGGRYSGVTFMPAANLRLRAGVAINSERLDRFSFDPAAPTGPLALTYDASQSKSLLGGISWDASSALGLDVTAITSQRNGVPLGFDNAAAIAPKASTQALGFSAHMDIGQGWVTTASFSTGLTQLDQRDTPSPASLHEQAYSFAIAKHGLFGDDTLGLSFSRPAPSMAGSFATGLTVSDDLPPLIVSQGLAGNRAAESDIQLGYVTNFLNGAVALQTHAAYQTNFQGQPGATSVSVLSNVKYKF